MQFRFGRLFAVFAALSTWLGITLAAAPANALTVDEVIQKGKLVVGIGTDNPPYGSLDTSMQPQGSDVDVANLLAKYLGVELEIVQVTSPNRIPYLLTNRVDIIIATLSITPERALQVWYSIPYGRTNIVLVASKSVKIETPADTAGLRVGVPRGAVEDVLFSKIAPPTAEILRYDDNATAVQAMIAGQIDVLGTGWLVADNLNKNNPGKDFENKIALRESFFGIGVRRGDIDLLQWINTTLLVVRTNGELDDIHKKWFNQPLGTLPTF